MASELMRSDPSQSGKSAKDCGTEMVLSEQQNIDDQIEWLDTSTLLYGLPRDGSELDNDIWSIKTDPNARPVLFIEHAWSPSVVR